MMPFEARRSRTFGGQGGLARDAFNSLLEALYDGLRAFLDVTGPTNLFDVLQDFDQVVRVEGHDLRRSRKISRYVLDIPESGGTHLAQALRQNQVRLRGTERLCVDLVERTRRFEPLADHSARLAARLAFILEQGSAHDRFCLDRGRMVAFRRDADHILAEPQGVADFRGRGEEGNNPHAARRSDTPRPLKVLFKRARRFFQGEMNRKQGERIAVARPHAVSPDSKKWKEGRGLPDRALAMFESLRIGRDNSVLDDGLPTVHTLNRLGHQRGRGIHGDVRTVAFHDGL